MLNKLKINFWFLLSIFAVIFLSTAVTGALFLKANGILNKKLAETAEANRPANLDLTIIADAACQDCFDLNPVLDSIKKENIKISSQKIVDRSGDEGKQLIAKYAIQKLTAFLLQGELDKNSALSQFFDKTGNINEGVFVF